MAQQRHLIALLLGKSSSSLLFDKPSIVKCLATALARDIRVFGPDARDDSQHADGCERPQSFSAQRVCAGGRRRARRRYARGLARVRAAAQRPLRRPCVAATQAGRAETAAIRRTDAAAMALRAPLLLGVFGPTVRQADAELALELLPCSPCDGLALRASALDARRGRAAARQQCRRNHLLTRRHGRHPVQDAQRLRRRHGRQRRLAPALFLVRRG